jgi:predicted enzyme related to lactoylglutathione lyase
VKAGGKIVEAKAPEGEHGFVGQFEDPEGNVMGLYQVNK